MSDAVTVGYLEVYLDGQTQRFALGEHLICRIGRATRNTMALASSQVSRDHALADCPNGRDCYITDLGSLNGTHVNGSRITAPCRLADGDLISIGEFRIGFRSMIEENTDPSENPLTETQVKYVNAEITVLVADIVGFTELSQELSAEKLAEIVGGFHRESGALLQTQGAWGQKFIGDAVMAIWVHHNEAHGSQFVRHAMMSAYSIAGIAECLQQRHQLENPVRLAAALNSGFASMGNLGSDAAADYTALGDTVNKAFRLEAATREVGCELLLGLASYNHFETADREAMAPFLKRQEVELRGYSAPVSAYSLSFEDLRLLLRQGKRTIPM
ncbi:MAG: FHA domain-containing protein [Acidobacteria bacterium]|nr:FHA domain-containing protein [Acidobacteriota bacterium]